jgi:hypothetical protein
MASRTRARTTRAQSRASKSRASGNAEAPRANDRLIAIRAFDDKKNLIEAFVAAKSAGTIARMAREWGYILRVRTRWAGDSDMRDQFAEKAHQDLEEMGIGSAVIQRLTLVRHIEIELYDANLDAAAEIPWEYLLSSATQALGRADPVLVTRCFANGSTITPIRPSEVLVVESAPGRISAEYDFDDEETRLKAAVNLPEVDELAVHKGLSFSRTEQVSKLQDTLRKGSWQAIHVTGVDTHQAAWLIADFYDGVDEKFKADVIDKSDRLQDGMVLRGNEKSEQPVRYDKLAELLVASTPRPQVVTLNLYYSGARTARELVRRGAYAALGFLDEIDDEFAERFFQAFYWEWCRNEQSVPRAFLKAWGTMDGERMHGTGIVVWLGRSMVGQEATSPPKTSWPKKTRRGGR